MKRKLFLLFVLASAAVQLQAQTRYTAAIAEDATYNINNNYPCPVANIDMSASIAAVRYNATTTAFCLINHSGFFPPFMISPYSPPAIAVDATEQSFSNPINNFTVYDIAVVDQYAFFCGTIDGTQAFYGYLEYIDILVPNGNVNVNIYTLSQNANTTAPAILKKMVAYKDGTIYKVVAIGDEDYFPYFSTSKVVEIFDAAGTPYCEVVDMPNNSVNYSSQKVFLDDIVLTDNYVAVLGHDMGEVEPCTGAPGQMFPWISFGQRSSVVGDICGYASNYYLDSPDEANNEVKGVALDDDLIAMAYVHPNITYDMYTRFRVIDLSSLTNINSQEFGLEEKMDPVEMTYIKSLGKVELLQPILHPSDFVQLDPKALYGYTTDVLTHGDYEYQSLDWIKDYNYSHFISTRNAEIYIQDRTVTLHHSDPTCPDDFNIDVEIIPNLILQQYTCPLNCGMNNISFLPIPDFNNVTPAPTINVQCFSYE